MPRRFDPYALPPTDAERAELEAEFEGIQKRLRKVHRFARRCGGDNYYRRLAVQLYQRQDEIAEILARPEPPPFTGNLWS